MVETQKIDEALGLSSSQRKGLFDVLSDHYCGAYFARTVEGFVHNLNSPLQILWIRSEQIDQDVRQLQDMLHEIDRQEVSEIAQRMRQRIDSLEKGMNDLSHRLGFLRGDIFAKQRSEVGLVDLNQAVKDTLFLLNADMFFKHQVEKELRLADELVKVKGRYSDFCVVTLHLIQNALESLSQSEERNLLVVTDTDGECLVLQVQDSGSGISSEIEPYVFKPFFTTKETLEYNGQKQHHAGLGLSHASHVLEFYGGTISLESHPSMTTFTVKIPFKKK